MLPLDTSIRAEYEDGFILDETELNDVNPYGGSGNTFTAVINQLPVPEHGRLVMFSTFWHNSRYDIDWTKLPDNARPIRFRHGSMKSYPDGQIISGFSGIDFGYQYTGDDGNNHQEVIKLR